MTNTQIQTMIEKLGTKERAIRELCAVANGECLAVHELWCYKELAEHFGITRGDYYNDYDSLTEEDKKYIGDNWKPNIENQLENLFADLKRESTGFQYFERDVYRADKDKAYFHSTLNHYEHHAKMLHELITEIKEFYPRPEGAISIKDL